MMGENIIFVQIVSEVNPAVYYHVLADETISQKKIRYRVAYNTVYRLSPPHVRHPQSTISMSCSASVQHNRCRRTTDAAQFEAVDKRKSRRVGIKE